MNVELREINKDNREKCMMLTVAEEQTQYICSNRDSLNDAAENDTVARPFAIYIDGVMVGFTMFAFDEAYEDPDDRYWLWRFMIDEKQQGKGYGGLALQEIIKYFKNYGANHIKLSTKESNIVAISLYRKFGFKENGEMNDEETVFQLKL